MMLILLYLAWSMGMDRAKRAGLVLADMIRQKQHGSRPVRPLILFPLYSTIILTRSLVDLLDRIFPWVNHHLFLSLGAFPHWQRNRIGPHQWADSKCGLAWSTPAHPSN